MSGSVLFWVQHLLGSGHLRRIAALARATAAEGLESTIASGGFPLDHLDLGAARLVQLEPLRAGDAGFRTLVDRRGAVAGDALFAHRRRTLTALVEATAPAVVVTETFPFGRRSLRAEALGLLAAAAGLPRPPLVVASVRDILQREERPDRIAAMLDVARQRYDAILAHGDARLIALDESFPAAALLGERVIHTGYVVTDSGRPPAPGRDGEDEVIVSVGGGAVGRHVLETAAAARPLSRLAAAKTWRLLTGNGPVDRRPPGAPGLIVEPNRADFPALLARCAVSVSQAGYNTATDLFASGARAVLVPFGGDGETEQGERARRLAERGLAVVVEEAELTPETLAGAIDRVLAGPPPRRDIALDGSACSARLLADWARRG